MSNKHYKEQKMLIENFRRWQNDEVIEENEQLNEDIISDLYTAFQDISLSKVLLDSFVDMFKG